MSTAFDRVYATDHPAVADVLMLAMEDARHQGHTEWANKLSDALTALTALTENTEKALNIAESWIHDQLDGTPSLNESLSELDSVRAILARIRGAE